MTAATRPATLVVLAWNRWPLTKRCLDSLFASDLTAARVLVGDNGSRDDTAAGLAAYPQVEVLTLPDNLGFVRGNNAAIAAADDGSDIVLLNNDLVITQADWLTRLRASAATDPATGIVGCRLRLPSGGLQHSGTYILPDTMWGQQIGSNEKDLHQLSRDRRVQGIVFACAYIKREVIDAIGGLATDFESYFEDTDYCLRAEQAGFHTMLCGGVTLVHDEHGSTRGDTAGMLRIFQASRTVFRAKWQAELEGRYRHQVLFQSIMNFPTGYAASCREILCALEERGVRAAYRYVYGPKTVYPKDEPTRFDDYRLNIFAAREAPRRPRVAVVYGQGDVFHRNQGRCAVGFTMLEVDGFPPEWVRQANRMAEVWVPSRFAADAFQRCGLTRPLHVVPLGVNPDYFHPAITGYPNPFGEFVFLSVFEWGERKSPWLLLKAFNDTFSADEPVRLVCKIVNRDKAVSLAREVRSLGLKDTGGKISYILNEELPRYQLGALYRSADCFVSPSRGEGWNMPATEAMACGLPTIATDWGPHREFLDEATGYPLRVRGVVPAVAKCPYYAGFSWADPDPDHLRHLLRHVVEHQDEARAKGAAAAAAMASRFTWGHTAERIIARLTALGA